MSKVEQFPAVRQSLLALIAAALLVAVVAMLPVAEAADEDTQASVYLVFDPETGEFVTVHDTEGQAQAQETQEAIESVAGAGSSVAAAPDAAGGSGAGSSTNPTLIIGLVVAAVIVGGALLLQRSRA